MRYCSNCSGKIQEDAKYCIWCGFQVVSSKSDSNSGQSKKLNEKIQLSTNKSPTERLILPESKTLAEQKISNIQPRLEKDIIDKPKNVFSKNPLGFINKIGGAVKQGARKIGYEVLLRKHKIHIKKLIIQEFDFVDLKKMCLYFNIGSPHPTRTNSRNEIVYVKPKYDHWAEHAFDKIELVKLKEYAIARNKIPYRITELEQKYKQERIKTYPEYEKADGTLSSDLSANGYDDELVKELVEVITGFKPVKIFKNEELYHTNLYTYLCQKIPGEIGFEVQRGSSRPDIVVGDIAIEIKGPTDNQGLITVADKINRYSQHFDHIIVVLFEVESLPRFYQEWYEGIMRQYEGQVTIIRK